MICIFLLFFICSACPRSSIVISYNKLMTFIQTLDLEEKTRNYLPHKKLLELVQSNLEEANVDGTKLMMEFVNTRKEKVSVLVCIRHPGHSAMLIPRTS
ncbi:hypothetical protein F2Q68_00003894 [Brassica cretica]|uniref:Uncharacterized protein n=1 Tax=Brassica cretica TaxID=69181 RepID=A0A8S9JEX5_BRACR|nr:hypothetical protein F2Q68_00003894 [Brassica cretica]